jgi:hypothetical protein
MRDDDMLLSSSQATSVRPEIDSLSDKASAQGRSFTPDQKDKPPETL